MVSLSLHNAVAALGFAAWPLQHSYFPLDGLAIVVAILIARMANRVCNGLYMSFCAMILGCSLAPRRLALSRSDLLSWHAPLPGWPFGTGKLPTMSNFKVCMLFYWPPVQQRISPGLVHISCSNNGVVQQMSCSREVISRSA